MMDENKETQSAQGQAPQQAPQAEAAAQPAPAAQPAATATAQPAATDPAAAQPKAEKAQPKIEKPANCIVCNKSIRKKRCYYRDGKWYCTKRCWTTAKKKAAEPAGDQQGAS